MRSCKARELNQVMWRCSKIERSVKVYHKPGMLGSPGMPALLLLGGGGGVGSLGTHPSHVEMQQP